MASKEDAGAKRQMFYDIECVIDDCDGEGGYKPLSDSDELDESAEEDELHEEGVDSSEEWEPLMRRSRAKRHQHGSPSASVPRRRGRPRKHPPQSVSIAAGRSLPIHALYSSPKPGGRGRPLVPNNKSRIPLMPKLTLYPPIIPKPVPFSTPLLNPILTFSPNSTSMPFPNNIPSNSSPIPTSNPTLVTFSHDSTHASLPCAVPSITSASNSTSIHTSDPTHTDQSGHNSTPITTLISIPNETGLLLDTDTNKISDSCSEKELLNEKVDSVKECVASPERSTSPTPIAKKQRLSSPSPPAITPVRRRGRPRKHAPKIIPNSTVEPATVLNPKNESSNSSNLTNEPATDSNPKNESSNSSNLTNEPATVLNPKNESSNSSNLTNEPATDSNPKNESSNSSNLTNESANTSKPTDEASVPSSHTAEPVTASNQTPAGSLADSGLDENRKSAGIIDVDKEDLWEDCVETLDISESTSPQPRDVASESQIPNPTMSSSDYIPPVPTPRRRGRPPKRKKPISNSTSIPIIHTPSESKHTPNPNSHSTHTSPLDLSWVKSENGSDSDQWHDITIKDVEPLLPDFSPKRPPGPRVTDAQHTPLQLFQLFFSTSVMQTIVRNTNSYAEKAEGGKPFCWVPLTVKEFCSFLALVLYMGLVKVDTLMDYWARKSIYSFPYPQSVMSRERFQAIFSKLYLCDPQHDIENNRKRGTAGYDRLLKIKPLYTDVISACRTHFHPNREISVDERTKIGSKQHSITMGYKLFVLFDSSSGYNWNFFVYEGKSSTSGVGYDAVMRLLDVDVLGKGYRLFTDTFYTSPTLFRHLLRNDIVSCGLLRHTSGLLEENVLSRKADRGSIRWCRHGPLLFVKWTNVSEIVTCSTMHKAFAGDFISRSVRGAGGERTLHQIPIPPAVKDCNKFTGGEDSTDAMFGYNNILYKTKKWYKTFFFHFLEIAVVNSYVLHRHMAKAQYETPLSQKVFREELISELERVGKDEAITPSELSPPVRTEQCLPEYFSSDIPALRRICAVCRLTGNDVTTTVFCSRCRVALCCVASRNCFQKWHLQRHLDL